MARIPSPGLMEQIHSDVFSSDVKFRDLSFADKVSCVGNYVVLGAAGAVVGTLMVSGVATFAYVAYQAFK